MKPFDGPRHAFWLVAIMLAVQAVVVLAGAAMCLAYADAIVAGRFVCDHQGKLSDLLTAALAVALAYSTTFRKDPP